MEKIEFQVERPEPTWWGKFDFVESRSGMFPKGFENQCHQVLILDPWGRPMMDVRFFVGLPGGGGHEYALPYNRSYWNDRSRRAYLNGFMYYSMPGPVKHTTSKNGGEHIWVEAVGLLDNTYPHSLVDDGIQYFSSDVVTAPVNEVYPGTYQGCFLTFIMRRMVGGQLMAENEVNLTHPVPPDTFLGNLM